MLENGFVKLPRSITKRKWFNDRNTLQLYVTLLLKATFRESEFEGVKLKPGQLITSISKLGEVTCQTARQTRTALNNLKATGDIAVQATPKFSIITLNFGFDKQSDDKLDDKPVVKQGDKQNDNIIRREKEEGKEESKKEEREEGGASPAYPTPGDNSFSVISDEELDLTGLKARLVKEYGSELVEQYEAKFRAWSSAKHAANVPMYPTIAKWLAADAAPKAPEPAKAASPQTSKPNRSFDTDRLRAAVLASYNTPL